jgi:hypothetical protein
VEESRNDAWTHPTEQEAIARAREIIESEERDTVIVVRIIAVVRRRPIPVKEVITVEKV